jgi:hypothetical protein
MADEKLGMRLDARKCSEIETMIEELVETVGMLLPMLEIACRTEGDHRMDCLQLAKETSARGTVVIKMLLWQWNGLRNLAHEEAGLIRADELRKEFQFLTLAFTEKPVT